MGGMNAPFKPGEGNGEKYSKAGAAALRMGKLDAPSAVPQQTNESAAANLRAMLYKDGEQPGQVRPLSEII